MLTIGADERAAMQLDDVASALDAGLPIASLHGDAAAGERALHSALHERGVELSQVEDQVLLASWRAGRAGTSLRSCAAARRQRAEFQRTMWAALRYPLLLLGVTFLASLTTAPVIGSYWLPVAIGSAFVGFVVLLVWIRASLQHGGDTVSRLPLVGGLVTQLAELPYLEVLQNMYGSGVPLAQAHRVAVDTVRLTAVRRRLEVVDRAVHGGRSLGEGLAEGLALHPETRTLVTNGERAGQLEEALGRALLRRREVTARNITSFARRGGHAVYAFAVIVVAIVVVKFYTGYFGLMLQGTR